MMDLRFENLPAAVGEILMQVKEINQRIKNGEITQLPEQANPIDTKELCKRLAITEPTAIRWRKKGKIPYFSIGSSIRYDWNAVINALQAPKKGKSN